MPSKALKTLKKFNAKSNIMKKKQKKKYDYSAISIKAEGDASYHSLGHASEI